MKKTIFVLLMLFLPLPLYAAPTISGVTGTVSHGNILTVSGTNYGTKSGGTAPIFFEDWEEGADGTNIADTSSWINYKPASYGPGNFPQYESDQAYGQGSLSMHNQSDRTGGVKNNQFSTAYQFFSPTVDEIFVNYKYYVDITGTRDGNMKLTRVISDYDSDKYSHAGSVKLFNGGNGGGSTYGEIWRTNFVGDRLSSGFNPDISEDEWQMIEMYVKLSTAGQNDGAYLYKRNNSTWWSDSTSTTRLSGFSYEFDEIWLGISFANPLEGTTVKMYIDDLYVDNTRARVIIGNANTFNSCTVFECQPATDETPDGDGWEDTEIEFTCNQGAFAANSDAWLYVVDANGVNSNGFAITFGSGYTPPIVNDLTVSGVSNQVVDNGDSVTIAGSGFEGVQGGGNVYIIDDANRSGNLTVTQTISSWADTSIDITVVKSTFAGGQSAFIFIKNNSGTFNTTGFPVTFFETIKESDPFSEKITTTGVFTIQGTGTITFIDTD